jgi:hypothetical protein
MEGGMMKTVRAFLIGMMEFRSSFTVRFSDLRRSHAYDLGRDFAHFVTFRRYDA